MAELLDNCRFTAGSSGTADFSDGTATPSFRNLEDAGAVDGTEYAYKAQNSTGSEWEIGRGLALETSGGWVLERTSIQDSSNGGSAVNFGANPVVIVTAGREELNFRPDMDALFLDQRMTTLIVSDALNTAIFSGPDGSAIHDHFNSLTYVDVGGATNLDTSEAGCLKPFVAVTTTLANTSLATNQTGFTNYNHRMRVAGSQLSANGSAFRLTLAGVSSGTAAAISGMYAGHKAAAGDAYDFDGTQVQVTVGGNASFSVAAGATVVTDWITYAFDETKDFVVAFHTSSGDIRCRANVDAANFDWWTKTGSTEVSTANVTGYTQSGAYDFGLVSLIEVKSGLSYVSVCSQAISAAEQPETMRALVLLHDAVGITLNTDTLVDLSRDGGTTWTTATIIEAFTQPGNIRVLDTGNVDVRSQPSGSSLRWRWRTANGVAAKNLGTAMWGTA